MSSERYEWCFVCESAEVEKNEKELRLDISSAHCEWVKHSTSTDKNDEEPVTYIIFVSSRTEATEWDERIRIRIIIIRRKKPLVSQETNRREFFTASKEWLNIIVKKRPTRAKGGVSFPVIGCHFDAQTSVTIDRERDWIQGDVISMYRKKVVINIQSIEVRHHKRQSPSLLGSIASATDCSQHIGLADDYDTDRTHALACSN